MELRVGTSGFSYREWKGPFYPEALPARRMLAYYAERLPAVEINATFYRMPKASLLESWAAQVPESFRFVLKASRRITHIRRLVGAEEETEYLLRTSAVLGERLGALLFQLPPNLAADPARLEAFLGLLPPGTPVAFEFRHPSWATPAVEDLLRAQGHALAVVDADAAPAPALPVTGPFGYLRLRGAEYAEDDLAAWARRVADTGWERAFVFFKHEDAGAGPRLAQAFRDLAGRADARLAG